MIIRTSSLRRVSAFLRTQLTTFSILSTSASRPTSPLTHARSFTTSPSVTTRVSSSSSSTFSTETSTTPPPLDQPLNDSKATGKKTPWSSCPAGTILTGLNYFKGQPELVAKPDEEYPAWLWQCLEVKKKATADVDADAGDEFSKSKRERRLAAKRQRQFEAEVLAKGDVDALAPKIPMHKQTVNLPDGGDGTLSGTLFAAQSREELRRAMRKDRKAKIKESNYLKSM